MVGEDVRLTTAWRCCILPCDRRAKKFVAIVELSHRANEARNLVVYAGEDGVDASARWRAWGRVLRLPLLIEDREGTLHPAGHASAALHGSDPQRIAGQ